MIGAKGTKNGKNREGKGDIALVLYRIMGAKGTKNGKNREGKGDIKVRFSTIGCTETKC